MTHIFCEGCHKRSICNSVCQEVEAYVNQDHVKWSESPVSLYFDGEEMRVFDTITKSDKPLLTPTEKKILKSLAIGFTRFDIAKTLSISMSSVYVHIHNLRRKTLSLFS